MRKKLWRAIFVCAAIFLVANGGLSMAKKRDRSSCDWLYRYVDDDEWRMKITKWADEEVLLRRFSPNHFMIGRLSGPGLRTDTLDPIKAGIDVPEWLDGYEIRLIGGHTESATLIYLGAGRYRGLLIGKEDMDTYSRNKQFDFGKVKHDGRVGVVCYKEE